MSQSSTSIKRETRTETVPSRTTTYQTSSSYERSAAGGGDEHYFKSTMAPRTTIIQRTSAGHGYGMGGGSSSMSRRSQMAYGAGIGAVPSGAYSNMTVTGVTAVRTSREREKKDMQDLNERFASYIEKVRFLEAQNRRLADELEKLKSKWGKETSAIKAMYQAELDEARRLLDDAEKEKARLEIRCASLEEQIEELRIMVDELKTTRVQDRETIERQNQQLSDYEAEINLLRRRIESLESDRERDKKEIARLTDALNRARIDLDNETLNHIDAENRRQTLEEELEFLKQVHEQEMKELAALAYRDTTSENREFWKNEMANALREISSTYDEKLDAMRGELETYYNLKIQEFRTGATRQNMESVHAKEESKKLRGMLTDLRAKLADLEARNAQLEKELELLRREHEEREREWESENAELKNEVAKLRAEMEAILKELQDLMDTKLGLELEIAAYRKLLEGEENRLGLKQVVESIIATQERRSVAANQALASFTIRQSETSSSSSAAGFGSSSAGGFSSSSAGGFSSSGGGGGGAGGGGGGFSSSGGGGGGGFSSSSGGGGGGGGGGYSQMIEQSSSGGDSSLKVSQVVKGEMSAKTTYQRSAKGPVSIMECAADGKYVAVENTGRKEEHLGGWRITRNIDGQDRGDFTFPKDLSLRSGGKMKVWGKGHRGANAGPYDIEANQSSWGIGANITTKLHNPAGEDRATHVQKTIYTS